MTDKIVDIPYIDDLTCSEVYADVFQVLPGPPGLSRFEFCVNRWSQHMPIEAVRIVPVARLVIPAGMLPALKAAIDKALEAPSVAAQESMKTKQ